MEPTFVLQQRQKLIMTPDLKQALTILSLPALELGNYIQGQLEENPVLELPEGINLEVDVVEREGDKVRDTKELFDDSSDLGYGLREHREMNENLFDPVVIQYSSLHDYLKFQLNIADLSHIQRRTGEFIIDSIDGDGYLSLDVSEITAILKVKSEDANHVLRLIKTFDPLGVGARDLTECLKLQLDKDDHRYDFLVKLLDEHLEDIAANRMMAIAKGLKTTVKEAQNLVDVIKSLDPKPGLKFSEEKSIEYVTPDVIIERVDDEYIVLVNDTSVPRLKVSSYYRNLVKSDAYIDKQAKKFVESKLHSALWLIKNIEQRRQTLYKVANAVVECQRDFLEKGIECLCPLTLKEVADRIGVHESTVSRTTKNKYVQTPRGVFPWKFFFASGIANSEGDTEGVPGIKKMIQDLFSQENSKKPLSDQRISELLREKGVYISRRTVAKYRDELNIPSSSRRKRF